MMEAENNPVNPASESQPETSEENEVEVEVLRKYGCGSRVVVWVSALGWYGLLLSLLSILASLVMVLTPGIFEAVCGLDSTCSIMTVATGGVSVTLSCYWVIFSVKFLRRNKDWNSEEFKDLVKKGCFVIACNQVICWGYFFTTYIVSLGELFYIQAPLGTLAADIIYVIGSLALITFSGLLMYGVLRKKTKPVQTYLLSSLVLKCCLIINFCLDISSSGMEFSYIVGLIVTLIHLSYGNGLVILHYNILLHDMGFYKKNLEFFNKAFQIQV